MWALARSLCVGEPSDPDPMLCDAPLSLLICTREKIHFVIPRVMDSFSDLDTLFKLH